MGISLYLSIYQTVSVDSQSTEPSARGAGAPKQMRSLPVLHREANKPVKFCKTTKWGWDEPRGRRVLQRACTGWGWRDGAIPGSGQPSRQRTLSKYKNSGFSSGKLGSFWHFMHSQVNQGAWDRCKSKLPAEMVFWLVPEEARLPWRFNLMARLASSNLSTAPKLPESGPPSQAPTSLLSNSLDIPETMSGYITCGSQCRMKLCDLLFKKQGKVTLKVLKHKAFSILLWLFS